MSLTDTAVAVPSSSATSITIAEVAKHNSPTDCWSVVRGNAYDLTPWIAQHPGGAEVIIQMCGIDGTSGFAAQHGGQGKPERELGNLLIGPVTG
jgi:cytochrome b involved in lipid metabolism